MQNTSNELDYDAAFVLGSLRSGTTLLRIMLGNHPDMNEVGELNYAVDFLNSTLARVASHWNRKQIRNDIVLSRSYRALPGKLDVSLPLPERFRKHINDHFVANNVNIGTFHRHFMLVLELFPKSKFIHIVRDPRDVAKSAMLNKMYGNTYSAVQCWLDAEESWDSLKLAIDPKNWIEVRYEQLVSKPENCLTEICKFVGLEYHPSMIDFTGSTYSPPEARHTLPWMDTLTSSDLRHIESRAWPLMIERDYRPQHLERPVVSTPERVWLEFDHKIRNLTFSIGRYGPWLTFLEKITRRTGPESLWRQTLDRMDEIAARYLK